MDQYVKVEFVGEVYSSPEFKSGTKKDGGTWNLVKISVKADGSMMNCSTFSQSDIDFISRLQVGNKVFITGFQKKSKGNDGKWYTNVELSFIQCRDFANQVNQQNKPNKPDTNVNENIYNNASYEEPQAPTQTYQAPVQTYQAPQQPKDNVSPYDFVPDNQTTEDDDLPF